MIILENQKLFQCSYCGKRLLTKQGAELHEKNYCHSEESPHIVNNNIKMVENQKNCKHEHIETKYYYIPGEAVMEPQYDFCVDCGMVF